MVSNLHRLGLEDAMSRVKDLLEAKGRKVHVVPETETVAKCAETMTELGVGSLVVVRGQDPVGIVTLHDIVRAVAHRPAEAVGLSASEIMTKTLETTDETADLAQVRQAMLDRRIRHMPVLRSGEVVGLVTLLDVVSLHLRDAITMSEHLEDYIYGRQIR